MNEKFTEDLVRKASRVVKHATEKGKRRLLDSLTMKNVEAFEELLKQMPIFYENDPDAPRKILLDDRIKDIMPDEFFDNPSEWIESQQVIKRGDNKDLPSGQTIGELVYQPYDVSKVRQFVLSSSGQNEVKVLSKRVGVGGAEEISVARKAYDAGIPTPQVLGEVYDKGNLYAFFERLEVINLNAFWEKMKIEKNFKSDLYPNFSATTEDQFQVAMEECPYLPKEIKDEIQSMWVETRPQIIRELTAYGLHAFLSYTIGEWLGGDVEAYKKQRSQTFYSRRRYHDKDALQDMFDILGVTDVGELIGNVIKEKENGEELTIDRVEKLREEALKYIKIFRKKVNSKIREALLGFDYMQDIDDIKKQCEEKGVPHKDFALRNFIVPWDFANNKPNIIKGKPRLYIVDWESQKESKTQDV